MVRKFGDKQMCEIEGPLGRKIMVSYSTPVVVRDGNKFYVTEERYSKTTTRHINLYLRDCGAAIVFRVHPDVLKGLVAGTI